MNKVLYPGSFDPMTKGHMNIVDQASDIFDEVVVAVMQNPAKPKGFFTLEERMEMVKDITVIGVLDYHGGKKNWIIG